MLESSVKLRLERGIQFFIADDRLTPDPRIEPGNDFRDLSYDIILV